MASGPTNGGRNHVPAEKKRFLVYRRRVFKGRRNITSTTTAPSAATTATLTDNVLKIRVDHPDVTTATFDDSVSNPGISGITLNDNPNVTDIATNNTTPAITTTTTVTVNNDACKANDNDVEEDNSGNNHDANVDTNSCSNLIERNIGDENENNLVQVSPRIIVSADLGSAEPQVNPPLNDGSEDLSSPREQTVIPPNIDNNSCSILIERNNGDENENNLVQVPLRIIASAEPQVISLLNDESDDLSSPRQQTVLPHTRDSWFGNGMVKQGSNNNVEIMASRSKQEMRKRLESELDTVRSTVKKIEVKEGGFSRFYPGMNDMSVNKLRRVHSEVASAGVPREYFRQSRALNQLSVSVLENSQVTEHMEKEKRTPKANQFYRNSEFLLAKDKFPPAESNKKSNLSVKKQDAGHGFGFGLNSKFFKRCYSLLDKLMKHKHGWVFNAPVDVKSLGLHDYFTIITHPMDLGTIKLRVNTNWYKSPKEFAEDVRLTFNNAMTYNPKGQDVHIMAEQLLNLFEDKWAIVEADYDHEVGLSALYDMTLHTPTSRRTTSMPMPSPLDMRRILDRSESMTTHSFDSRPKSMSITPSGRTPAPKKPKARDMNKREMTYDEKQKLSTNLSNLPAEKLDAIVQIMKKRNSELCQLDDEIEVDIDSVDTETLWELDRFVTNYKKGLSKRKRKAELALQARVEAERRVQKTPDQIMVEAPRDDTAVERNASLSYHPVQVEKMGNGKSRSSSSSSSSSDSGSSSSDSDSDSSSASGSDGGRSQ